MYQVNFILFFFSMIETKGWSKCQMVCITERIKTNVTVDMNLFSYAFVEY